MRAMEARLARRTVAASGRLAPRPRSAPAVRRPAAAAAAAGAAAPTAGIPTDRQQLLQLIAQKEAELAAMFERRPLPKAAEVTALRREVSSLQAALAPLEGGRGAAPTAPAPAGASLAAGGPGAAAAAPVAAMVGRGGVAARQADRELAERLMREMDVLLRKGPTSSEAREMTELEAENKALREQARALLQHQAQLEGLVAEAKAAAAAAGGDAKTAAGSAAGAAGVGGAAALGEQRAAATVAAAALTPEAAGAGDDAARVVEASQELIGRMKAKLATTQEQ